MKIFLKALVLLNIFWANSYANEKELTTIVGSYEVACNNLRTCQAVSYSRAVELYDLLGDGIINIHLERAGEPSSPLNITFGDTLPATLGEQTVLKPELIGQPMLLQIGKHSWSLGNFTQAQQASFLIPLPAHLVPEFIKANDNDEAKHLTLKIGNTTLVATLVGLKATLRFMDEQQKRKNTTSALVLKGKKVMRESLPQPKKIQPIIATLNTQANLLIKDKLPMLLKNQIKDCEEDWWWTERPITIKPLDTKYDMVMIICTQSAYNHGARLFKVARHNPKHATRLSFKDTTNHEIDPLFSHPEFNPRLGKLTSLLKGRGIGDCGTYTEWIWTGKEFTLSRKDTLTTAACLGGHPFLNVWETKVLRPIVL